MRNYKSCFFQIAKVSSQGMLRINLGEGSFPPGNGQCQTGKLLRLLRYFAPGSYSDPLFRPRCFLDCRGGQANFLTWQGVSHRNR
jgi:hypothetical protein